MQNIPRRCLPYVPIANQGWHSKNKCLLQPSSLLLFHWPSALRRRRPSVSLGSSRILLPGNIDDGFTPSLPARRPRLRLVPWRPWSTRLMGWIEWDARWRKGQRENTRSLVEAVADLPRRFFIYFIFLVQGRGWAKCYLEGPSLKESNWTRVTGFTPDFLTPGPRQVLLWRWR